MGTQLERLTSRSAFDGLVVEDREGRIVEHRAREEAANAARRAEEQRALDLLRAHPALAPHTNGRGMRPGAEIALRNGMTVRCLGPVRMREDGACALAQVEELSRSPLARGPRRYWMPLAEFAGEHCL